MEKLRLTIALIRSKAYIVITETAAAMSIVHMNPNKFSDIMALQIQTAALEDFQEKLGQLIKEHKRALKALKEK